MLVRFLLAILMIVAAPPVSAEPGCHGGMAARETMAAGTMSAGHGHAPHDRAAAMHQCLGCVPPAGLHGPAFARPVGVVALAPTSGIDRLDLGSGTPPALPPPRE